MIGTSWVEHAFIRISIFAIQCTAPCFVVVGVVLIVELEDSTQCRLVCSCLAIFVLFDAVYAMCLWKPFKRRLQFEAQHPPSLSRHQRQTLFQECFSHVSDINKFLKVWFLHAEDQDVRHDNVREFLLWAFFDLRPDQENECDTAEIDKSIRLIENQLGYNFLPGRGNASCMRPTLDRVEIKYRSVLWYMIVAIVDVLTHIVLRRQGFNFYAYQQDGFSIFPLRIQYLCVQKQAVSSGLNYWYRSHSAPGKRPVLFIHGIGIGLSTYAGFLAGINPQDGGNQIGVLALELPAITFRLSEPILPKPEFLAHLATILSTYGWTEITLVAHSYGTVLASYMLKSKEFSAQIRSVVLIDPVSILLHQPDVAYNFTRRRPCRANEWQLWYFASMDPSVALTLSRHMFWKDSILWKDDLLNYQYADTCTTTRHQHDRRNSLRRRNIAVCLSGRDLIVDTLAVARYLMDDEKWHPPSLVDHHSSGRREIPARDTLCCMKHGDLELLWFPKLDHAQVFDRKKCRSHICNVIRRFTEMAKLP